MMTTVKLEETGSTRDSFSGSTLELTNTDNNMSDNKVVLVVVVAVALVSLVALILAAVALSKSDDASVINVSSPGSTTLGNGGGSENTANGPKKIYTIHVGHNWGAHNYLDQDGYITGFTKEVIDAVCNAAGIQCVTVWDKWSNCWDSQAGQHSTGGLGLMAGWYDGCSGWAKSISRTQVFDFGIGYLKAWPDKFFVLPTAANSFNPKDITGKKIGFHDGWVTDEKCVARQTDIKGSELEIDQIKHYNSPVESIAALKSGAIDVIAGDESGMKAYVDSNEVVPKGEFKCQMGGGSIMTRKDSDLVTYWNDGFTKIQSSGRFAELCKQAQDTHGHKGDINCV